MKRELLLYIVNGIAEKNCKIVKPAGNYSLVKDIENVNIKAGEMIDFTSNISTPNIEKAVIYFLLEIDV